MEIKQLAFLIFAFLIFMESTLAVFFAYIALVRPKFFWSSAFPESPPTKEMFWANDRAISDRLTVYYGVRCFGWGGVILGIVVCYRTLSN